MENQSLKYQLAREKVNRIKYLYFHILAYVIIDLGLLIMRYVQSDSWEDFLSLDHFMTLFIWTLVLSIHLICVFALPLIFGEKWEEKKIQKILNKENH
ncbi:2TM domain-containing protein [Epilithonimonas sp. UC225_85]|uniref:2TM domain-containing protein n=1 Tax=Epilithonimonas sp. UC225_85 TaxID=3350167 RepID=UPI0036D40AA1